MKTTLYDKLNSAGCEIDNHESDLYVRATDVSRAILKSARDAGEIGGYSVFANQADGSTWFDVAFMYSAWWDARATT